MYGCTWPASGTSKSRFFCFKMGPGTGLVALGKLVFKKPFFGITDKHGLRAARSAHARSVERVAPSYARNDARTALPARPAPPGPSDPTSDPRLADTLSPAPRARLPTPTWVWDNGARVATDPTPSFIAYRPQVNIPTENHSITGAPAPHTIINLPARAVVHDPNRSLSHTARTRCLPQAEPSLSSAFLRAPAPPSQPQRTIPSPALSLRAFRPSSFRAQHRATRPRPPPLCAVTLWG